MKKRKFVAMTITEYVNKRGGWYMCGCPSRYGLDDLCGKDYAKANCGECWRGYAKRNGRYILKEVKDKRLTYLERKYLGEDNV